MTSRRIALLPARPPPRPARRLRAGASRRAPARARRRPWPRRRRRRARPAYEDPGGMWMPEQLAQQADTLKSLGLGDRPVGAHRSHLADARRHREPGRLLRVVRLRRRPRDHQPPLLRRRAPVQLQARAGPAPRGLHRQVARRREVERAHGPRPRHAEPEGRDARGDRRARGDQGRHRPPEAGRGAAEGAGRGLREGAAVAALQRGRVLRRRAVPAHRAARDQGRAPGLRPARSDWRLRRRGRQLALAAPRRRRRHLPRLRGQGRQARRALGRQRPLPSAAPPQARAEAPRRGRPRPRRRLPRRDQPPAHGRRGGGGDELHVPALDRAGSTRTSRSSTRSGRRARTSSSRRRPSGAGSTTTAPSTRGSSTGW